MPKIGIGLLGTNGHQIAQLLRDHSRAEIAAAEDSDLDALLADPRVAIVSLCSPRRADQVEQAVRCLQAGRHVYSEKPCARSEADLDRILDAAGQSGRFFHEMAGTAFADPYPALAGVVRSGALGTVVQVFVQKSYPYFGGRPQDEAVDGGLFLQVGIHAARMVEHVAGCRIAAVDVVETGRGNPVPGGGLRMAASAWMTLENGGVASMVANYLNQDAFGTWSNEHLRIFGTDGFVEATDGGLRTRLVLKGGDRGPVVPGWGEGLFHGDYFDAFLGQVLDGAPMPLSIEEELHPLRMLLRAHRTESKGEDAWTAH